MSTYIEQHVRLTGYSTLHFYRATHMQGAVYAVARDVSVRHTQVLYRSGWNTLHWFLLRGFSQRTLHCVVRKFGYRTVRVVSSGMLSQTPNLANFSVFFRVDRRKCCQLFSTIAGLLD